MFFTLSQFNSGLNLILSIDYHPLKSRARSNVRVIENYGVFDLSARLDSNVPTDDTTPDIRLDQQTAFADP